MTTKKYWFYAKADMNNYETLSFDTLDDARAALRKQIVEKERTGGTIFSPRTIGTMIVDEYSKVIIWKNDRGGNYCPVRENGSVISGKRAQEIIGF